MRNGRFAGEVTESVAEDLDSALSAVSIPAFELTLAGVGAAGNLKHSVRIFCSALSAAA